MFCRLQQARRSALPTFLFGPRASLEQVVENVEHVSRRLEALAIQGVRGVQGVQGVRVVYTVATPKMVNLAFPCTNMHVDM
jgi:DNA primase